MSALGSMTGVLQSIAVLPKCGRGRLVMVMAARQAEGVSTVVRSVAESGAAGVTLLLDLDLMRSDHHRTYTETGQRLADGIDARLKGQALYRIVDASGHPQPEPNGGLAFYRVGRSRLFVSGFDASGMREGYRLQIPTGPAYWAAVRESCELCVVDAPALERSRVGVSVSAHMDGVVLVASGAVGSVAATVALKAELEAAGAFVMGVVYTRADRGALTLERASLG